MTKSETKDQTLHHIRTLALIPVIRATSPDHATRAIDAIREGGIDILEITMTVPGAVRLIEQLTDRYADSALIGAGTVLDPETARACILAGARFIVSPALNLETIALCQQHSIPVIPGALTPTEVVTAWQAGADMVKIFPCGAVGGASYIKALKAPLPQIDLIPTGGVNLHTAADFLKAGASALGVGADLVDTAALQSNNPAAITTKARQFLEAVNAARE
jgi:2-dehydro-3-deoxyphosphogluconate aldolase/(4S)-4-hydroxy-2-oxoglutarate aldolase